MDALSWLNRLGRDEAVAAFLRCCGSELWAEVMASSRPFKDEEHVHNVSEAVWGDLPREGWLQAFAAHPKIGNKTALKQKWAGGEQAGASGATDEVLDGLAQGN